MASESWSAEQRLLCACARRSAQSCAPSLSGPETDIDWNRLIDLATAHGVTELLYAPLSSGGWAVPPRILADLERRVVEATGQGLQRTTELAGLVRLLNERGIRVLAFKGPVLAVGAYGHVGRRLSSDLDLFVERRDYRQACAALLTSGYRPLAPGPGVSQWLLEGIVPVEGRHHVFVPGRPAQSMIDLHVAFATWRYGIRLNAVSLFERSTTVDVAGHRLPTLHPHDLLLVLAIHGMSHQWRHLRLVSDIDAAVALVTDWADVVEHAEAAGMRRMLWVALLLAERLLGTALPTDVRTRALADTGAQALAEAAAAGMFAPDGQRPRHARGWPMSFIESPYRRATFVVRRIISGWLTRRHKGI